MVGLLLLLLLLFIYFFVATNLMFSLKKEKKNGISLKYGPYFLKYFLIY